MKLLSDWKLVLRKAWSIKLLLVAGLLTGIEALIPLFPEMLGMSRQVWAVLVLLVITSAFVARLLAQSSISGGSDV